MFQDFTRGCDINIIALLSGSLTVKNDIMFGTSVISDGLAFLLSIVFLNSSRSFTDITRDLLGVTLPTSAFPNPRKAPFNGNSNSNHPIVSGSG